MVGKTQITLYRTIVVTKLKHAASVWNAQWISVRQNVNNVIYSCEIFFYIIDAKTYEKKTEQTVYIYLTVLKQQSYI